jgi:hypothetical protein
LKTPAQSAVPLLRMPGTLSSLHELQCRRRGNGLCHQGVAEHRVFACLAGGVMEQRAVRSTTTAAMP